MSEELVKQVRDCIDNDNDTLLFKAILYEVAFQYDCIKEDYTDFDNVDLSLDDIKKITDIIVSSYYLNEGLVEMVSDRLYDYINNK